MHERNHGAGPRWRTDREGGGSWARKKTRNDRGVSRGMKFLFRIVGGLPLQSGKVVEKGRRNGIKMQGEGCMRSMDVFEGKVICDESIIFSTLFLIF